METNQEILSKVPVTKTFFVGVDSDGCAFDTMELKHKECFIPEFIRCFGLQAVSKHARGAWEFVNLYSRDRGINRFLGLLHTLEVLSTHPDVKNQGFTVPQLPVLSSWAKNEKRLGNEALQEAAEKEDSEELNKVLEWSMNVNSCIQKTVTNMPPFPWVRESLSALSDYADIMVVSSANKESLDQEWSESRLKRYVHFIAHQDLGKKQDHIRYSASGRYNPSSILIIGDAPGDFNAARSNNALFYPIVPGEEAYSWNRLLNQGIPRFIKGGFSGEYQQQLINDFFDHLPELPPWQE
ncbi:MAG: HAD hydrolase-like protein [Spirochaetia bacterium]